jgi:hypothetical protein
VKIALDPFMFRHVPLLELPALVAELGYAYIELSPRPDFIPFFVHPRADRATIKGFRRALDAASVEVTTVLPLYRWAGPDEDARQAAVRYWKRATAPATCSRICTWPIRSTTVPRRACATSSTRPGPRSACTSTSTSARPRSTGTRSSARSSGSSSTGS